MSTLAEVQLEIGGKYCSGYKGVCYDGGLDTYLPLDKFSVDKKSHDGKQSMCKKCHQVCDAIRWTKRPRHPVTGEVKRDWKYRIAKSMGGIQNTLEWKGYLDRTEVMWQEDCLRLKAVSLVPPRPSNIAPFSYPPEHEKRLRQDGRTAESAIIARKAKRHNGFNYVMEHPSWPERKIGWTYDPPSRLSDFNVCCPHKLFTFTYISVYLEDAKLAESTVQAELEEYHTTGEWYLVSRELAVKTIEDYVESLNDRKEQAMD